MQVSNKKPNSVFIPIKLSPDSVDDFNSKVKRLIENSAQTLSLDCSNLDHITSEHVGLLWQTFSSCRNANIAINLDSPSPGLVRTLEALDLYDLFTSIASIPVNNEQVYVDAFKANVTSIDSALDRFQTLLSRFGLEETIIFELKTMFYEITTNIRQHALADEDELIFFSAKTVNHKMTLTFVDTGIPFDPRNAETVTDFKLAAKNKQRRGFGISMVKKIADNISYVRMNDGINILTLEKKWSISSE